MGSALETFTDFVNSTGPAFLTSGESVVNEAVENNYLLRRMLRGNDMSKILQGGRVIRDEILFDESSTFQYYQPNETFTWENPQVLSEWEINWRFANDHLSFTDQEVELNVGSGMSRSARFQTYKRLKRVKEQRMWTSMLNGMEAQLFKLPSVSEMESSDGLEPYSIPAFVNEYTNGQFGEDNTSTFAADNDWGTSTIEGIDPDTETRWRPAQVDYTVATTGAFDNNVLAAFDDMFYRVKFDTPPTKQEYFEKDSLFTQFIACSRFGINIYKQLLRDKQDLLVTTSRQDPAYTKPQYSGIDLEYVAQLDDAALYDADAGSVPVAEAVAGAASAGPRYYWLNGKYLCPVFHTERYMKKHPAMRHPNQPYTTIVPCDSWYNLVCRSRQRLGIVYPSGGDVHTA